MSGDGSVDADRGPWGDALLVDRVLLDGTEAPVRRRLALAGVAIVPCDPPFTARSLRLALAAARAAGGWLVTCDASAVSAAASAALAGVVLIGCDPPPDDQGLVVARAESLADAPRVMVPRGGGCWHEHRT